MIPRIDWNDGTARQLDIGYALDNAVSYSKPRAGSEHTQGHGGVEVAWITGTDYELAGDVRWIPSADSTNPVASGWDAADGWEAFLRFAREKNTFTFIPDITDLPTTFTCYLVQPLTGAPAQERDGTRRLRLVIRNSASAPFTGY